MEKRDVFNQCLMVFNYQATLTDEDIDNADYSEHPEIQVMELMYSTAIRFCQRARAWSFLDVPLSLGDDLGGALGYAHSYELPKDLFRVTWADGRHHVVGSTLLTDGSPVAYGQMNEVPETGVPEDFTTLVAYALAMFVSAKLSPGDTKTNLAQTMYSTLFAIMQQSDVYGATRHGREDGDESPYIQ